MYVVFVRAWKKVEKLVPIQSKTVPSSPFQRGLQINLLLLISLHWPGWPKCTNMIQRTQVNQRSDRSTNYVNICSPVLRIASISSNQKYWEASVKINISTFWILFATVHTKRILTWMVHQFCCPSLTHIMTFTTYITRTPFKPHFRFSALVAYFAFSVKEKIEHLRNSTLSAIVILLFTVKLCSKSMNHLHFV